MTDEANTSSSSESSSSAAASPSSALKFSIETILHPHFGQRQLLEERKTDPLTAAARLVDERSLFPAWVYCTRYSDRPSAGPRTRRTKRKAESNNAGSDEDKRPRTAFTSEQLERLRQEFLDNRYLTEKRRQEMAHELGLNESQIKIWFQNKRAKLKKASGERPVLALHLMAQGLYNHTASGLAHV